MCNSPISSSNFPFQILLLYLFAAAAAAAAAAVVILAAYVTYPHCDRDKRRLYVENAYSHT